jgi:hypothetical protein
VELERYILVKKRNVTPLSIFITILMQTIFYDKLLFSSLYVVMNIDMCTTFISFGRRVHRRVKPLNLLISFKGHSQMSGTTYSSVAKFQIKLGFIRRQNVLPSVSPPSKTCTCPLKPSNLV